MLVEVGLGLGLLLLLGGGKSAAPAKKGPAQPDIDEREAAGADVVLDTAASLVPGGGSAVAGFNKISDPEVRLTSILTGASTAGMAPAAQAFVEDNPKVGAEVADLSKGVETADVGKDAGTIEKGLDNVVKGVKL